MIITITGRVGSGKDTVVQCLNLPKDYQIIDADKVGHECLLEPEIINQLDGVFHGCVKEGVVDRKQLAALAFPHRVRELNRIVHPCLIAKIKSQLTPNTVIHAALLQELKLREISEVIVLVESTFENTLLHARPRLKNRDLLRRLKSQRSLPWYRKQADYILENNSSLADLQRQVDALCQTLF